jgi:Domain of unknown function (DUF2019)
MSSVDYTKLSTEELIERFIDESNRVGTIVRIERVKVPLDGADWEQANKVTNAIAAELERRNAVAAVRAQLFENPSPDVRGWAGMKWANADPVWAMAAFTGVLNKMTTKDVLDWRDRILRGPPKRPALKQMSVAQLLERFVDVCERCYGSTRFLVDEENTNMSTYNKIVGEKYEVAKELYSRGELSALVPFMDHSFLAVRQAAASYCLDIAEEKALGILEPLSKNLRCQEGVAANMTLTLRRLGKRNLFSQ